jgi:hypothetical protein
LIALIALIALITLIAFITLIFIKSNNPMEKEDIKGFDRKVQGFDTFFE